jgi:hypothetical protein
MLTCVTEKEKKVWLTKLHKKDNINIDKLIYYSFFMLEKKDIKINHKGKIKAWIQGHFQLLNLQRQLSPDS